MMIYYTAIKSNIHEDFNGIKKDCEIILSEINRLQNGMYIIVLTM